MTTKQQYNYPASRWREYNRAYYHYRQTGDDSLLLDYYKKYGSNQKNRSNLPPQYKKQKNYKKKKGYTKEKRREYNRAYAQLRRHNDPGPLEAWRDKYRKTN